MRIEQAFFGDRNGSHNLLATSFQNNFLIGKLKSITDKPASIDVIYPYLSGYRIEDYYVFCRTMNDSSARRTGMVFTHCLISPISQLNELKDISQVLNAFVQEPVKILNDLQSIDLDTDAKGLNVSKPDIYNTTIHYLINSRKTVIYLGYDFFEEVIQCLWFYLPTRIKENFSFTIAGTPNEINNENYSIVHTPADSMYKWGGFNLVKEPEKIEHTTLAHLLLTEKNEIQLQDLNQFIKENEIEMLYIYHINEVVRSYDMLKRVEKESSFSNIRNLIPALSKLIPQNKKGGKLKKIALEKLITQIRTANCNNIKSLRNLNFDPFLNGQKELNQALVDWAKINISERSKLPINEITDLLYTVFEDKEQNWVNVIIVNQFSALCENVSTENVQFIWLLWKEKFEVVDFTNKLLPTNSEMAFFDTFPKGMPMSWNKSISEFARNKKWFSLYALTLVQFSSVKECISLLIKNVDKTSISNCFDIIAQNTSNKEFVLSSIQFDNYEAFKVSGKLCAKSPSILEYLDVKNTAWQIIWKEFFLFSGNIALGVKNIEGKFYTLLDLLVSGDKVEDKLLDALSLLPNLSIYNHGQRNLIWNYLPLNVKERMLNSTALFVYENYKDITIGDLESELTQYLKSKNFIRQAIFVHKSGIKYKMQFLEEISMLNQEIVREIVDKSNIDVVSEAIYLADKIKQNGWRGLLNYLYDYCFYQKNISLVLRECKSMLSGFQRLALSGSKKVTKQDVFNMIESDNLSEVFIFLDNFEHKGSTYRNLKDEFMEGHSKGVDRKKLGDRLKVYVNSL